jgi:flagellar motor switch protein FliM
VIERQTLGRVSSLPPELRRPTRTDAAMVAGLIDAGLAALDTALQLEEDRVWAGGFRYASHLSDARPLALILEDAPYRVLRAEVALGAGEKRGTVLLARPAAGRGTPPPPQAQTARAREAVVFTAALGEQVMAASSVLDAVLARITLPLAQVMALGPGEVLRLGSAALDRIDFDGIDGVRLGGGRLGQNRGMRAVRLAETEPVARAAGGLVPGLATVDVAMARTGTG